MPTQSIGLDVRLIPKGLDAYDIVERTLSKVASKAKSDYLKTVKTWKEKPIFVARLAYRSSNQIVYVVTTDNEIYGYVDLGTRPHKIRAKGKANGGADRLAFQSGFTPKTKPNKLSSGKGAKFGSWRTPYEVNHPGTEARNFTKVIADLSRKRLEDTLEKEITKWINKTK